MWFGVSSSSPGIFVGCGIEIVQEGLERNDLACIVNILDSK
jgi:hypothetical protein